MDGADASRPQWQRYALKWAFRPEAAARVNRTIEMHFADHVVAAEVRRGRLKLARGPAENPDLVVKAGFPTFMAVIAGHLAPTDALSRGLITFEAGSSDDQELLFELFSVGPAEVPVELTAEVV